MVRMTHDTIPAPRYVITATAREGIVQQTRVMAASAMALARSWRASGYVGVEVKDPSGKLLTPEAYREAALNGRKRFC